MAEQTVSDLIMKFVGDDGNAIAGETVTELNLRKSPLSVGFNVGEMFEIQSFTLKTGIGSETEDEMNQKLKDGQSQIVTHFNANAGNLMTKDGKPVQDMKIKSQDSFKAFRDNTLGTNKYPIDMKPFEFTRSIDLSSPTLLDYCIKRRIFRSASLIKRKAAGGPSAGEIFFRLDFNTVLIKSIDWDNDDPIKESCEFVCRSVTINYLPQLPDGTLGASKHVYWTAVKNMTEKPLS